MDFGQRSFVTWTIGLKERIEMDYRNEHCEIAAQMLDTEPGLLDYRLVERLNQVAKLVKIAGVFGRLQSRQVIASIIVQWQEGRENG